eukprot:5653553-Alexandrium_andersonii.AAC.1
MRPRSLCPAARAREMRRRTHSADSKPPRNGGTENCDGQIGGCAANAAAPGVSSPPPICSPETLGTPCR